MYSLQQIINNHGLIDAYNSSIKILKKTSMSFDFDPIYLKCNESKFTFKPKYKYYVDYYGTQTVYVDIVITIQNNYDRRKTI